MKKVSVLLALASGLAMAANTTQIIPQSEVDSITGAISNVQATGITIFVALAVMFIVWRAVKSLR